MNKINTTKRFGLIRSFVKPFKMSFANLLICVFATSFIGMTYPYIFGLLVDEVFYHRNIDFFKIIVISYGVIYIGEQILHMILNFTWAYLMTRFLFDIRKKIFQKIFFLKASYLSNIQTGELITRINKDAEEFMNFIHWNVFFLIANILRLLVAVAFVAVLNIKIALLMIIAIPLAVYTSRFFAKKVKVINEKYRGKYGNYISWVFEIIRGMREIRLLAAERTVNNKFVRNVKKLIYLKVNLSFIELGSERANAFISLLTSLLLYIISGILIINGELTVGAFIAIIDYFARATKLLQELNEANIRIQNNMVAIDRVVNILNEDVENSDENTSKITINNGKIEFENLNFSYNENSKLLKNLSLSIDGGEKISLVGKSGEGKSTLANILLRFYEPLSGNVKIDGNDIKDFSIKSLRRSIGIVQQDTILFDGTIRYNLKLGNPKSTDSDIMIACEKAHIFDFINNLPKGLDTIIGTDGINLSGGQRQRIAIARIFLKDPKILIFDEATSALDNEAEQVIQKSWKELSEGRTTINIAHRLSTILDSDRVAVLNDGKIIACNHHKELLQNCEHYKLLFKEQYTSQEEIVI